MVDHGCVMCRYAPSLDEDAEEDCRHVAVSHAAEHGAGCYGAPACSSVSEAMIRCWPKQGTDSLACVRVCELVGECMFVRFCEFF